MGTLLDAVGGWGLGGLPALALIGIFQSLDTGGAGPCGRVAMECDANIFSFLCAGPPMDDAASESSPLEDDVPVLILLLLLRRVGVGCLTLAGCGS